MVKNIFSFLFISLALNSKSQTNVKSGGCDCKTAITFTITDDLTYGPTNAPTSAGINEINSGIYPNGFDKEHHSAWYKFTCMYDGILTFTISPTKKTDDYDFMLFKLDSSFDCNLVSKGKARLVAANLAQNDSSGTEVTGLNKYVNKNFENKGSHNPFSKAIRVKSGENYSLILDNVSEQGIGHSITFKLASLIERLVYDATTKKRVKTEIQFINKYHFKIASISENNDDKAYFDLFPDHDYKSDKFHYLVFPKKGYLTNFRTKEEMSPSNRNEKLYLEKIAKDSICHLRGIYFNSDLSLDVTKSDIALHVYLDFLKKNLNIKLNILAVYSENIKNEDEFKTATTSLIQYFVTNGVSKTRFKNEYHSMIPVGSKRSVTFKVW